MNPSPDQSSSRLFTFCGGHQGRWRVQHQHVVAGEPLPVASFLDIVVHPATPPDSVWTLRGITSNERYSTHDEKAVLKATQEGLDRPVAVHGALIPIKKNRDWWLLSQDERRKIFEEQSHHIQIGLDYLPAIARRLHHCRDLGPDEPFDFLTWFEFAPEHEGAFNAMLARLRASVEWRYVSREIDIRVSRPTV